MSQRFLRIYKALDIQEIREHLLIGGDLFGQCAHCQTIGLKLEVHQCPQCHKEFKYIAFKNIKDHLPKLHRLFSERPEIVIVDYEDFKRLSGALRAEEFLK